MGIGPYSHSILLVPLSFEVLLLIHACNTFDKRLFLRWVYYLLSGVGRFVHSCGRKERLIIVF